MHTNPSFRTVDEDRALADAKARGFGILTVQGPDGILASHIPFLIHDNVAAAHLVKSNPIARLLMKGPVEGLLMVSGPDAYISSDWYGAPQLVPTWNYVAIHLRGEVRALPAEDLRPHLEALSEFNEGKLAPKKPWTMDKMEEEAVNRMMRMLLPIEMEITSIESTYKLNQNRGEEARGLAADAVEASTVGQDTGRLAALMRDAGDA